MESLKIILVVGVLAAGVAIGLAYLFAALFGGSVTSDEIVRHALISFIVVAIAILTVRRRTPP